DMYVVIRSVCSQSVAPSQVRLRRFLYRKLVGGSGQFNDAAHHARVLRCHLTAPQTVTRRRPWCRPRNPCGKVSPSITDSLEQTTFWEKDFRGFAAQPSKAGPSAAE